MSLRTAATEPDDSCTSGIPRSYYPVEFAIERRALAVLDADFRFVDVNGVFEREIGLGAVDLRGTGISEIWDFDPSEHVEALAGRLADLGVFLVDAGPSVARPTTPNATLQLVPIIDDEDRHLGFTLSPVTEQVKREKRKVSLDAEGFQLSFDQIAVGMLLTGLDGYAIKCNPAMVRILGRSLAEIAETDMISMIHPDHRATTVDEAIRLLSGEADGFTKETRLLKGDGTPVWLYETATCVRDTDGNPLHFMSQFVDISDRKQAEAERELAEAERAQAEQERKRAIDALLESESKIKFLFDGTPVPLLELDASLTICAANAALERLLGRDPIGMSIIEVVHPDDMVKLGEEGKTIQPNTDWIIDIRVWRHDGSERLVRSHGRIHHDEGGLFRSATATWHDITDAKQQEDRLRIQAATDPLTGLPHRATFLEHLDAAVAVSTTANSLAVLFVDLDHFKPVNDGYGHEAGDHLLCQVARRLRMCVRSTDVVARLGGDEFVVLVDLSLADADPAAIGQRIVERLAHPFATTYGTLSIGASVGLAYGGLGSEPRDIVHRADLASYQAKADGRSRLSIAPTDS